MQPNRPFETGYAGVGLTYARVPLELDPAGWAGADVVILGAPFDEGVSYRPGTRFGPRAIRQGEDVGAPAERPNMELGVDPYAILKVLDGGDVDVRAANLVASHAALQTGVGQVLEAGASAVVLGGDHSLSMPVLRAIADRYGPDGYSVIHFDTHADTGLDMAEAPHGVPFSSAVQDGYLRGSHMIQIGLRGNWPYPDEFAWMREQGFRWRTVTEVIELGIGAVVREAIEFARSKAPRTYLTIDIDVLDPAFAPGTGTAEPGGLMTRELLYAARTIASEVDLCAMDLVEVSPPYDPTGITAMAGHRVVYETLSGMALRRSGGPARPERS
jgi:agmatinase